MSTNASATTSFGVELRTFTGAGRVAASYINAAGRRARVAWTTAGEGMAEVVAEAVALLADRGVEVPGSWAYVDGLVRATGYRVA